MRGKASMAMLSIRPGQRPSVSDVAVLLVEAWLLVVCALIGSRLGSGWEASSVLAVLLPSLLAVAWARWLTPGAARRFARTPRVIAKLSALLAASAMDAVTGNPASAVVFFAVSASVVIMSEYTSG